MRPWRRWTRSAAPLWVVLGLAAAGVGTEPRPAAPSSIAVPADLPNQSDQLGYHFRWALVQAPTTVRAVGVIESPNPIVRWARVALFGVNRDGRVVSRGETEIQGGFGRTSLPFEITLRPTGREERFDLVLVHAQEGKAGD